MSDSILFAIVSYKEKYYYCDSYRTLLSSYEIYGNVEPLNLMVFDNTDSPNWEVIVEEKNNVLINYECPKVNTGISFAYNRIHDFAQNNNFGWIVFFDQDTSLPLDVYQVYKNKIKDKKFKVIAAPIVMSNEKVLSPCPTNSYRKLFSKPILAGEALELEHYTCINSGLMVNTQFYAAIGGYDENLKLDFCDHDFIERAKKSVKSLEVLNLKFIQDFSTDNDNLEQSLFRYKIFINDYKEYAKTRNKIVLFLRIDVKHLLKLSLRFKTLAFLKIRIN